MATGKKTVSGNGTLVSAALIIGVASMVSRVIGLVRERVFTTTFGAGDTFDAFVAAFRVPDFIFSIIVIGALSAAFIPLFTGKLVASKKKSHNGAFDFAVSVLNLMVLVVGVLCIVYALFAPVIVPLITPGFSGEKLELTIMLSRIMAFQPVLLAISFVFSGVLNSFKRFVAYAIAPIVYNLGIIVGVIFFVPLFGPAGIGWGVVLGAVLHMGVQLPSVLAVGFRWKAVLISSKRDLLKLWKMMLPRMFGLAAQQVNLFVVTIVGSGLVAGSITAFHLANNIQHIPVGVFGLAFAQAAFPTLSEQIARKRLADFRNTLTKTFRYILFFVIPLSVFFFLLRAQIVRVLFGDGAFDWEDTILTFETFGFLLVSVFAQATIPLLARAFYAQHNTKVPVAVSVVSMVLNVVLALYLAPTMGVQGLALAFSLSAIVQLALLLGMLHWKLRGFNDLQVLGSLVRIVIATVVGGVFVQLLKYPVASVVDMQRFWGVFVQVVVALAGGISVYLILCWLMKSQEMAIVWKYIPRKPKLTDGMETSRFSELSE